MTKNLSDFLDYPIDNKFTPSRDSYLRYLHDDVENQYPGLFFWDKVFSSNYKYIVSRSWRSDKPDLSGIVNISGFSLITSLDTGYCTAIVGQIGDLAVYVKHTIHGKFLLKIGSEQPSPSIAGLVSTIKKLSGGIRSSDEKKSEVDISFCSAAQYDDYQIKRRKIAVPFWEDIKDNYPSSTKTDLDEIMNNFNPSSSGGQLMVWHGDPGTGKTFALRALLAEWQTRCNIFYVIDPDLFFGNSAYMIGVISDTEIEEVHEDDEISDLATGPLISTPSSPWRLLIMEDAGNLITADASERAGNNSLSRFLNLVDGLIGQGMKTQVLITSNEPLSRLHPAVSRSGRCSSIVQFNSFDKNEANEWLKDNGSDKTVTEKSTLAHLFSVLQEKPSQKASLVRPVLGLAR